MITGLFSIVISLVIGYGLVALLWPREERGALAVLLKVLLAVGVGFGVTSCVFYLWILASGSAGRGSVIPDAILALLALRALMALHRRREQPAGTAGPPSAPGRVQWIFVGVLCVAALLGVVAFVLNTVGFPNGVWDAWAIWNLHARFLYLGGAHWADGFSPLIPWSHPDYPLLVPASVARAWLYAGSDTVPAPAAIALLFTFGTAALAFAAVSLVRGRSAGALAGVTVLAAPGFFQWGAGQIADIPLSFFILATVALLALHDRGARSRGGLLALAGVCAGLAGWTKNEGLLFIVVLVIVRLLSVLWKRGWRACAREGALLLAGLLPVVAVIAAFKGSVQSANEIVAAAAGPGVAEKLTDWSRYTTILGKLYHSHVARWAVPPVLFYLLWLGFRPRGARRPAVAASALILALVFAGYLGVYLLTPHDLAWHLATSLNRLIIHLWPAAMFCVFVAARTPEELLAPREVGGSGDPPT
jgi:hypothetical protein